MVREKTLHDIAEGIRQCTACPLWKNRLLPVSGKGESSDTRIVLGIAPSEEENRKGEILDISKGEGEFVTHLVKCFPGEMEVTKGMKETCCKMWLVQQVELLCPEEIDMSLLDEESKEVVKRIFS